jgi:hypothetical protein
VLLVDLADVRRLVIIAMFSDDVLFGKLVLKGGNAISLVYTYGARSSLDVDFSIEGVRGHCGCGKEDYSSFDRSL